MYLSYNGQNSCISLFDFQVPEFPKISDITYTTKNYWNKGVTASFVFLSELPSKSAEWSIQGYEYVVKQLETNEQKNPNTTKS
mgnify:CR=1 FL=1